MKQLKIGFDHKTDGVRQAYIKLAGAMYAALNHDPALKSELEATSRPGFTALLSAEFEARRERVVPEEPPVSQEPLVHPSPPLPTHRPPSRRFVLVT